MYAYTCVYVWECVICVIVCAFVWLCTHMCAGIHTHVYACMRVHVYMEARVQCLVSFFKCSPSLVFEISYFTKSEAD